MSKPKVVLITGASSGIGEATARIFGSQGYRVCLAARRIERLEKLAAEIDSHGGQALPVQTDVASLESIRNLVDKTLQNWGQIDILFNNAGIGRLDWLDKLDPQSGIDLQLQVNISGVIQTTRQVLPHMIERRRGHIINMSSLAGFVATPTYSIYAAGKFALRGFGDALRREVGVWGIKVTTIFPGGVQTEFKEKTGVKRKTGLSTPSALLLSSADVARAVYRVVQSPRRIVVLPRIMWFSIWLNALLPGVVDRTIENRFVRPERGIK